MRKAWIPAKSDPAAVECAIRAAGTRLFADLDEKIGAAPEDLATTPGPLEDRPDVEPLKIALASLPEASADLLRSLYGLGRPRRTCAQIGRDVGVSRTTVGNWRRRAMALLRESLGAT